MHQIVSMNLFVASNDQSLNMQTDEGYALEIAAPTSSLSVHTDLFPCLYHLSRPAVQCDPCT